MKSTPAHTPSRTKSILSPMAISKTLCIHHLICTT
jgi:hypothetical protein